MSVILNFPVYPLIENVAPPHRIPISGATARDVELVREVLDVVFNSCQITIMGQLGNLSENLPLDLARHLDKQDIIARLQDLRSDTLGRLEQIEGELS